MSFIRAKTISGQRYAYLVKNSWTAKGPRQKVAKYLGKIHKAERERSKTLQEYTGAEPQEYFGKKKYTEIIEDLLRLELHNHKLEDKFFIGNGQVKSLSGKESIIQANQGYICTETAKELMNYNPEADEGYALANLVTAAGINVEKDVFVALFETAKTQNQQKQTQPTGEFYY
ncbi:hypothetical protein HY640_00895 [Candidatus Woesearchaeota archaeon]|nr:hypothetical protein [Candidatus Woesearchaeota archaeon]